MAMRPRTGGAAAPNRGRPGGVRPVYVDFKPTAVWAKDANPHILAIHLPDFMKEQMKVSTEGHNTIRVRGERMVAGNKWRRFQEDYQVPEDGEINSVRAKFQGGSLHIIIPRKMTDKPQVPLPPNTSTSVETEKQHTPPPQKEQEKVLPATKTSQTTDIDKSLERKKALSDPLKNAIPSNNAGITAIPAAANKNVKEKNSLSEKADNIAKKSSERNKESLEDKKTDQMSEKEEKERDNELKGKESNDHYSSRTADDHGVSAIGRKSKRAVMKGISELNEERQLLVNVGVAVLVIVTLSAYVTSLLQENIKASSQTCPFI